MVESKWQDPLLRRHKKTLILVCDALPLRPSFNSHLVLASDILAIRVTRVKRGKAGGAHLCARRVLADTSQEQEAGLPSVPVLISLDNGLACTFKASKSLLLLHDLISHRKETNPRLSFSLPHSLLSKVGAYFI